MSIDESLEKLYGTAYRDYFKSKRADYYSKIMDRLIEKNKKDLDALRLDHSIYGTSVAKIEDGKIERIDPKYL